MRLHNLTHMHQFAQQFSRAGRRAAHHRVASFSRRQVMAHRADAADARGNVGHFKDHAAFAEFFKTAEFVHMQVRVIHRAIIVHADGDLGVPFNPGDGLNRNFLCYHFLPLYF